MSHSKPLHTKRYKVILKSWEAVPNGTIYHFQTFTLTRSTQDDYPHWMIHYKIEKDEIEYSFTEDYFTNSNPTITDPDMRNKIKAIFRHEHRLVKGNQESIKFKNIKRRGDNVYIN